MRDFGGYLCLLCITLKKKMHNELTFVYQDFFFIGYLSFSCSLFSYRNQSWCSSYLHLIMFLKFPSRTIYNNVGMCFLLSVSIVHLHDVELCATEYTLADLNCYFPMPNQMPFVFAVCIPKSSLWSHGWCTLYLSFWVSYLQK